MVGGALIAGILGHVSQINTERISITPDDALIVRNRYIWEIPVVSDINSSPTPDMPFFQNQ